MKFKNLNFLEIPKSYSSLSQFFMSKSKKTDKNQPVRKVN